MQEDFSQAFHKYSQSLIDGDANVTVDFMYPKIFNFIPREGLIKSLKAAQSNPSVKVSFDDFQINSVDQTFELNSTSYIIFTAASKVKMVYAHKEQTKEEDATGEYSELQMTYEVLVAKYGENNVKLDEKASTIEASTTSKMLAIKENASWYFLDLKPHWIELYEKFLPSSLIKDLQKLFPQEEEEVEVVEPPKKKKARKSKNVEVYQEGNIKRVYLAGWDVHLDGGEHCEDFIATQITTKEIIGNVSSGIELVFENDALVKAFEYDDGNKTEKELKHDEIGLRFQKFPLNRVYNFEESPRGKHQLGGEVPKGFTMPACNTVVPFQYLGFIDNKAKMFDWLPFKLHLTSPIYLNVMNVFLDYADPMSPLVINRGDLEEADTSHDELNKGSEIIFDSARFDFIEDIEFGVAGHAGIPQWIQGSHIPRCPKSGARMKFVCQLRGGVEVKRSNVDDPDDYFKEMEFWGDGDLFVFFEPTSKVACYFIQNT